MYTDWKNKLLICHSINIVKGFPQFVFGAGNSISYQLVYSPKF